MKSILRKWRREGLLRDIDVQFAMLIARLTGQTEDSLPTVSAALVSRAVGQGHSCLDLTQLAEKSWPKCEGLKGSRGNTPEDDILNVTFPPLGSWQTALRSPELRPVVSCEAQTPLVFSSDGKKLYLARYWQYEQDVVRGLLDRAEARISNAISAEELCRRLPLLFPPTPYTGVDLQKLAAFIACRRKLAIISGGPGTGKTYVAARILALLIGHAISNRRAIPLRVLLGAPTGKAAARMREAIIAARNDPGLGSEAIREQIPTETQTLHRMLAYSPHQGSFRFNANNPLPADVVVVDEASMVALPLMAGLIRALPEDASLILLGDMNQLASVEPGYVLGDICEAADIEHFSPETAREFLAVSGTPLPPEWITNESSPLADASVSLRISRRFPPESPLARLTHAINSANDADGPKQALTVLEDLSADTNAAIIYRPTPHSLLAPAGRPIRHLQELLTERFHGFLKAADPEEAFAEFATFRILCAVRQGPHGVMMLNAIVEKVLSLNRSRSRHFHAHGRPDLSTDGEMFYDHRPVLINENDYDLGLFNGDIGICLATESPHGSKSIRVHFQTADGGIRQIAPAALPAHETAFAMTVHKAQGSEFGNVLLIVPAHDSEVVTRELLYTAVSRTRGALEIWCPEARFLDAVRRKGRRQSGLVDALRGSSSPDDELTL